MRNKGCYVIKDVQVLVFPEMGVQCISKKDLLVQADFVKTDCYSTTDRISAYRRTGLSYAFLSCRIKWIVWIYRLNIKL